MTKTRNLQCMLHEDNVLDPCVSPRVGVFHLPSTGGNFVRRVPFVIKSRTTREDWGGSTPGESSVGRSLSFLEHNLFDIDSYGDFNRFVTDFGSIASSIL